MTHSLGATRLPAKEDDLLEIIAADHNKASYTATHDPLTSTKQSF